MPIRNDVVETEIEISTCAGDLWITKRKTPCLT